MKTVSRKICQFLSTVLAFFIVLSSVLIPSQASVSARYKTQIYSDVPMSNWAFCYVATASDRGFVSGKGNGVFDPDASVTGFELLKMLVCLMNLETKNSSGEAWYTPYWTVAKNAGLLKGNGRTTEKQLNSPLSRNDMALMCYRALENYDYHGQGKLMSLISNMTNGTVESKQAGVSDISSIPSTGDYRKAVSTMVNLGIITGDENGNFNGKNNMTRSQAATVLCRLNDLMNNSAIVWYDNTLEIDYLSEAKKLSSSNGDVLGTFMYNLYASHKDGEAKNHLKVQFYPEQDGKDHSFDTTEDNLTGFKITLDGCYGQEYYKKTTTYSTGRTTQTSAGRHYGDGTFTIKKCSDGTYSGHYKGTLSSTRGSQGKDAEFLFHLTVGGVSSLYGGCYLKSSSSSSETDTSTDAKDNGISTRDNTDYEDHECPDCFGDGYKRCTCLRGQCVACGGEGYMKRKSYGKIVEVKCTTCHGSGICQKCGGDGEILCKTCGGDGEIR